MRTQALVTFLLSTQGVKAYKYYYKDVSHFERCKFLKSVSNIILTGILKPELLLVSRYLKEKSSV
ncbi:hypothetical protein [Leeuwenhoekiella sp. NPDC079379]|uniref:hypothetical protein n=1 Tax=Leeuwenhoekiella sp. NPDC079379 TaxID=3364122 RepID=UPI0037C6B9F1